MIVVLVLEFSIYHQFKDLALFSLITQRRGAENAKDHRERKKRTRKTEKNQILHHFVNTSLCIHFFSALLSFFSQRLCVKAFDLH
jgi:hypothetical protein